MPQQTYRTILSIKGGKPKVYNIKTFKFGKDLSDGEINKICDILDEIDELNKKLDEMQKTDKEQS